MQKHFAAIKVVVPMSRKKYWREAIEILIDQIFRYTDKPWTDKPWTDKLWTRQTLDTTNPGHDEPRTRQSLDTTVYVRNKAVNTVTKLLSFSRIFSLLHPDFNLFHRRQVYVLYMDGIVIKSRVRARVIV
jgi:hypothetical protein